MEKRNQAAKLLIGLVIVILAVLLLGGVVGGKNLVFRLGGRTTPLTRDDISYKTVAAPAASSKDGTINAADWAAAYPEIVATMGDNKKNSYIVDYLD